MISWNVALGLIVIAFILPFIFLRSQLESMRRHARNKHAELDHLRHLLQDLELHVAKDKSLFLEALGVPFLLLRRSGRLVMANRAAGDLLDIDETRNINLLHVLTHEGVLRLIREATEADRPTFSSVQMELHGEMRYYRTLATPLPNEERHVGLVFHDVTEEQRTQVIRRDFVANASHELRTPLTIVRGYLETLLEEPATAADERMRTRALTVMKKHTDRLVRLVEDMLTVSRLENSQSYLKMEAFDLNEAVEETVQRLEPLMESQQADFRAELDPCPLMMTGDKFYWSQILFNLMENALKNNPKPGLRLRLRAARSQEGSLSVRVEDNGVGIDADALPYVFNRFYRADKTGKIKGTGLGLSIVKHAVEAHGGTVRAESRPGELTSFVIELPATPPAARPDA
ncbi:MAG TPA: cell wall metabolism sensor histidine kinase WalK [Candidatus Akkermansia intestinigallinarum]|uniref:histidine kinase n=1 Tax=Candidatus Akkermansia intestinigallinarum TaxID=2838431 RepID=A0A9D1VB05_9BACT|nr:cell wall metabolism sensor histidine kinase WalK [Candidatus Akkermansia intestinigallinarum]